MIAALYVETGGAYFGLEGVDPWDEARRYAGPHPVVAHPPCQRWGKTDARLDPDLVARIGLAKAKKRGEVASRGGGTDSTARIYTPPAFRELLVGMARSATASDASATDKG